MGTRTSGDGEGYRAAIYGRLSYNINTGTPDEGLPLERQIEDCTAVVERSKWKLVDTFTDEKLSAWTGKERPAWRDLLEACIDHRVDVVVAWRDDRLWRNVVEERQVSQMLAEHDVKLIAFASGRTYDPQDVDDQFTSGIHALVAEHESAVKAVRTRRALRQRALQGRWLGGSLPLGYRRPTDDEVESGQAQLGGLVVVEQEAEVIREMARRALAGESLSSIAEDVEERGVIRRFQGRWDHARVREILANPLYAGRKMYRGEVIAKGRWDPILSDSTHEALAVVFEARKNGPGRSPRRLLTGPLHCGRCGGRMNGARRLGVESYTCKRQRGNDNCGRMNIIGPPTDEWVSERVLVMLADSKALAERLSAADHLDLSDLTEDLRAWEHSRDELIADYYLNKVPQGAYMKARERLDSNIEEARGKLRDAAVVAQRDVPVGDLEGLEAWWEEASTGQRRALIEAVADRIIIHPWKPSMGRQFSGDRIQIIWRY